MKWVYAAAFIYFAIAAYGAYWDWAEDGYKSWVTEQIVEGG